MRRIISLVVVALVMAAMAVMMAVPAFAAAPQASGCGQSSSTASTGPNPSERADNFNVSVGELQKAHCGNENANPQGPPAG